MATFGKIIEGSAGTVVFGSGVSAQSGEIEHVDDDCLTLFNEKGRIVVPFSSIVYYRFADSE